MNKIIALLLVFAVICFKPGSAEASVCYVTDAGGCAYDECRSCVNLAPAVALGTIVVVAIVALAVQNSHGHSSHNSSSISSHSSSTSCSCQ